MKDTKRNHIARANRLVNKPQVVKPKKGKGTYKRRDKHVKSFTEHCLEKSSE